MLTMTHDRDATRESNTEARRIAAEWHGGMSSPLYALTSSGAIVDGVVDEIEDDLTMADAFGSLLGEADRQDLIWLRLYVALHGARGPVKGWSDLHF